MPAEDEGAGREDDAAGGDDVSGVDCECEPEGCREEDADEEGGEYWAGRGGRSGLGRGEPAGEGEERLEEDIEAGGEDVEGFENLVEGC